MYLDFLVILYFSQVGHFNYQLASQSIIRFPSSFTRRVPQQFLSHIESWRRLRQVCGQGDSSFESHVAVRIQQAPALILPC